MELPLYQVDAFSDKVFGGNPAAVCPLDDWLPDKTLCNIAAENNLSETAFFIPSQEDGIDYDLRWFMPAGEVDLCGHATLATAFVVFEKLDFKKNIVNFSSRSGTLSVSKTKTGLLMDFPIWAIEETSPREDVTAALGAEPKIFYEGKYWLVEFEQEEDVRSLSPDFKSLKAIQDVDFLIATAPANDSDTDFVSRFFCPQHGVDEDPVTGSAHCVLTPFWAERLNKTTLKARQISARGGNLLCALKGERVEINGQAVLYMEGKIHV